MSSATTGGQTRSFWQSPRFQKRALLFSSLVLVAGVVAYLSTHLGGGTSLNTALRSVPPKNVSKVAKTVKLEAKLSGGKEVPKAGGATGEAYIQITGTKVCWQFEKLKGFSGATASHIHKAPAGTAGPVLVPLGAGFKKTGCTTAPASVAKAIAANPKAYYVNIHTTKFPGGALRGQLGAAASS